MNVRYTFGLFAMVVLGGCTTVGGAIPPSGRSVDSGRALPAVATPSPAPRTITSGRALPAVTIKPQGP